MRLPNIRKYPKVVHITPEVDYQVKFVRKLDKKERGVCDPSDYTIKILLGMSPEETFKTFIHELIHACENEYNIKISHKAVYKLEAAIGNILIMNF